MRGVALPGERFARNAMEALGADSPDTAVPLEALPAPILKNLDEYVFSGLIREAGGGKYYLFTMRQLPWTRVRVIKAITFWLLVILIPVLVIQFSGTSSSQHRSSVGGPRAVRVTTPR
jgi:hypothetical protein